ELNHSFDSHSTFTARCASECDSGYARIWNGTITPDEDAQNTVASLREDHGLDAIADRLAYVEKLYRRMTIAHCNTLAYVSENWRRLSKADGFDECLFESASLANVVFKATSPLFVKERLAIFEAVFTAPNFAERPVTVMVAPASQYAPMMGRLAERSGFGPPTLVELEESAASLRHLLQASGIGHSTASLSTVRVVVMPQISVCSIVSLAAHNMHKVMNIHRYEEHVAFIMIQLLRALKCLQSDGIELMSLNFREFLLAYPGPILKASLLELKHMPKLMLLRETMDEELDEGIGGLEPGTNSKVGMCRYASRALCTLMNQKTTNMLPQLPKRTRFSTALQRCVESLHLDKSSSLTDAQNLLEYAFFVGSEALDCEMKARLWLDEKRARYVNRLVSS
ncbi:hypothetical protein AAVH_30952, partial [Aphelenchoides avenae]